MESTSDLPGKNKIFKVPKVIKGMLYEDEEVVATIRQSRLKALINPDSIFITNHRIILYSPHTLGLRKTIEDFRYQDMANIKVERGIIFSTIRIKQRFLSNELILDKLRKGGVDGIAKYIHEGIRRHGEGAKPVQPEVPTTSEPQSDDPLAVLRLRYARGEIDGKEFEEMKRLLE